MRKALCVLLACCMALPWCAPALAAVLEDGEAELQAVDTDRCGPNARWSLDEETGTLTISGTGEMTDYRYNGNSYDSGYGAPWSERAHNIRNIEIDNGITSIGAAAFVGLGVSEVSIPASVKRIGAQAFRECGNLQSVNIPDGAETIGDNAFRNSGLKSLTIPVSVKSIGKGAFLDCSLVYVDYQGTSAQWDAVQKGSQIFNEDSGVKPYLRCSDDASENPSGTCGDNITWEYYPNGCLVLRGTGNIPDFASADEAPWKDYRDSLQYVVIDIAANGGGDGPSLDIEFDEDKGTTSVVLARGAERTEVATGKIDGTELAPETNDAGEAIYTDTDSKTVTYSELEERYLSGAVYLSMETDEEAGVFRAVTIPQADSRGEPTVVATGKLVPVEVTERETNETGDEIYTDTDNKTVTYWELQKRYASAGYLMTLEDEEAGTFSVVLEQGGNSEVVATGKLVKRDLMEPETNANDEAIFTDTDNKTVTFSELWERYRDADGVISMDQDEKAGTCSVTLIRGNEVQVIATGKLVKVGEGMGPETDDNGEWILKDTDDKPVTYSELEERYHIGSLEIEDDEEKGTSTVFLAEGDKRTPVATGKLVKRQAMEPETDDNGEWILTDADNKPVTYSELLSRYDSGFLGVSEDEETGTSTVTLVKGDEMTPVATGKLVSVPSPEKNENGEPIFKDLDGAPVTYNELEWRYLYSSYDSRNGRIGNYAFYDCKNLRSVVFSDGYYEWNIAAIGDSAFAYCESLEGPVASNARTIGDSAFRGCKGFTNTWLWLDAETIGDSAFRDCDSLEWVWNLNNATSIGDYAFADCSGLTRADLSYQITRIGAYAFSGCPQLNELELSENLESVGAHAFGDCPSLRTASYRGTQEQWEDVQLGEDAFSADVEIHCYDDDPGDDPGYEPGQNSSGSCGENLTWELNRGAETLYIRGSGKMTDYVLDVNDQYPENNPWTEHDWDIRYVVVEDGVESIGNYAFRGCSSIRALVLPASLTEIGEGAFSSYSDWNRGSLSGIYYAGTDAQWNAVDIQDESLTDIPCYASDTRTCGDNLSWDLDIEQYTLTVRGAGKMDNYELNANSYLQPSTAPWGAFSQFISILVVEDGVTSIGDYAFAGLNVGTLVVSYYDDEDEKVRTEDGDVITVEPPEDIPEVSDFLVIPDSVESIGKGAFAGCGMVSFDIPPKVDAIAAHTFENCSSLVDISIPDGVTSIGEYAFSGCTSLGRGVNNSYRGDGIDRGESIDNPVVLPAALNSIGDHAFEGCTEITVAALPAGLTRLGASAFKDCSKLKSVRVPGGVTTPGASAFANCSDMASAVLENGVKTITNGLFSGCAGLDNVYIPASVTAVQRNAFNGCAALYQVNFGGSEAEWKAVEIGTGNEPLESDNLNVAYNVALTNEVASLEISGMDNVVVTLGMPLDISGMTVTAVDANGGREAVTGYSVYGFNSGRLGKQSIGVRYLTEETSFDITVVEPYVTEIAVSVQPVRRSYTQGEALDLRGLTLEVKYSDNSTQYVTEGFDASGYDKDKVGAQTVTISYEGKETALTVEVIAPRPNVAPPKISVTAYPGGKTISLTSETQGASLYYTTNGANPTESGTLYSEPFALTANATVKVCAILDDTSSDVTSVPITVEQVAALTADKSGATDAGTSVTLETATPGASIWYGPDAEHMTQPYTGGIVVDKSMEIYAVARKDGWRDSDIFHASYTANAGTEANEVNVSLGNSDSRAGENCAMPVYLFSAEEKDVTSFQISIAYDATTFAYDSISPAEGVENLFLNTERGKVTVQYNILQSEAEAKLPGGEVFTLNFKTLDSAEDGAFGVKVDGQPLVRLSGSDEAVRTRNQDGVITLKGSHNSQLTVQSAVLTDSAGNSVSASEQGAARMNVTLDPDAKQSGLDTILNVIQALYDSENKMVSLQMWETNLTLTGFIFSQDITIPADKDVAFAKLFILTDDLAPSIESLLM